MSATEVVAAREAHAAATELPAKAAETSATELVLAVADHELVAAVACQMLYSRYCPGTLSHQQHRQRTMYNELVLAVAGHELVPAVADLMLYWKPRRRPMYDEMVPPVAIAVAEHRRRPMSAATVD